MHVKLFGDMLNKLRLEKGLTLRKFCRLTGFDPGNVSRWERGKMNPPQDPKKLERIATALDLENGSTEYDDFISSAAISAGHIPKKTMEDKELLQKLPIFFRTLDGRKLSPEQLESLITIIKEES